MLTLIVLAMVSGCSYEESPCLDTGRISTSIRERIASNSVQQFSMSDVVPISWDRMFLFIEYTSAGVVRANTTLKFPKDFLSDSMGHVPEGTTLIVFGDDATKSPVCYELLSHPTVERPNGFLFDGPSHRYEGIQRRAAAFRIHRSAHAAELQLLQTRTD
jgi:hypothetical protein